MSLLRNTLNINEQRELFCWKHRDISRDDVKELFKDFSKYHLNASGEINEHDAMRLLESRGATKTATELRQLFAAMDVDRNRHLSFLEWCCAFYQRSYDDLNSFADEAAREAALSEVRELEARAAVVEAEIARAKEAEEAAAAERARQIEEETKLTGVAGMRAFFKRQVEGAQDVTASNESKIKEEAARRKALREANAAKKKAEEEANRVRTPEEIQAEMARKAHQEAIQAAAKKAEEAEAERRARAEKKRLNNERWGSGLPPPTPSQLANLKKTDRK